MNCPTCNAPLTLTPHDTFDSWVCPAGHGLAATLSELYEQADENAIHQLWAAARQAGATGATGPRACPMCARPMVTIAAPKALDVCLADEVIWFDAGELEQLPPDQPDAVPTAAQDAALETIRKNYAASLDADTGTTPAPESVRQADAAGL